jgi:hypothetical protein
MLLTLEGIYKDGKVQLAEMPAGVKQARVLVTFLPSEKNTPLHRMVYGQFAGERMSSEKDFLIAEWRGGDG